MTRKLHGALCLAALALAPALHAQHDDNPAASYPNTTSFGSHVDRTQPWFQQCMRVQALPAPPTPRKPASCKGYGYYDKLGKARTSEVEWRGVRACAVASRDNAVLAMLYANGLGVKRDPDLATRYACLAGGAPAELMGRVAHLQTLKTSPSGQRFDQCDDATSGYMMGLCTKVADDQVDKVRNAYFARLRRQLTPPQAGAFDQLLAATRAFALARMAEIDLSGTGRGAFQIDAQAAEKEWLRAHLAAFETGSAGLPPPAQFTDDDAELNRAYRAVMAAPVSEEEQHLANRTTTKAQVRAAQRAWLAYRDAWVAFAALRYPAIAPAALKAALSAWRSKQLIQMM